MDMAFNRTAFPLTGSPYWPFLGFSHRMTRRVLDLPGVMLERHAQDLHHSVSLLHQWPKHAQDDTLSPSGWWAMWMGAFPTPKRVRSHLETWLSLNGETLEEAIAALKDEVGLWRETTKASLGPEAEQQPWYPLWDAWLRWTTHQLSTLQYAQQDLERITEEVVEGIPVIPSPSPRAGKKANG